MKLNCDLGESFGNWQMGLDSQVMPFIDMANIACGFHAGDPLIMRQTVRLAKQHNVSIGAHPSYQDLQGFGRRSIEYSKDELINLLQYQIGALQAICQAEGCQVDYVKPHGALYNDMMANEEIFQQVCQAVSEINQGQKQQIKLMIQALPEHNSHYRVLIGIAKQYQLNLLFEAFADRHYQANGLLVPRSEKNAVIEDVEIIKLRITHLLSQGELLAVDGSPLKIPVDTLCVHGDNEKAVNITQMLQQLCRTFS